MKRRLLSTRTITALATLVALEVALTLLSNYVTLGQVNFNLALIPIAVGACMYGPLAGLFLGLVNGAITLAAPGTIMGLAYNAWATVLMCLIKTGVAGLVAGLIFRAFRGKKPLVGSIIASISIPLVNTGLYLLFSYLFFLPVFEQQMAEAGQTFFIFMVGMIWVNFVVEFSVSAVLSPAVYRIICIVGYKKAAARAARSQEPTPLPTDDTPAATDLDTHTDVDINDDTTPATDMDTDTASLEDATDDTTNQSTTEND